MGSTSGGANEAALGPRKPLSNSLGRPTSHRGKLCRLETVQVAQEQKRAVLRVEVTLKQIADGKQLEIVTLARFGTLREALKRTPQATTSTKGRKGAIARDPEQPRFRTLDRLKLIAATERLVEAVLQQILGKLPVVDHLN